MVKAGLAVGRSHANLLIGEEMAVSLVAGCLAHITHDGFTDMLPVLSHLAADLPFRTHAGRRDC